MPGSLYFIALFLTCTVTGENITYEDIVEKTMMLKSCLSLNREHTIMLAGEYDDFLKNPRIKDTLVALISESKRNAFAFFTLSRYSYRVFLRYRFARLHRKLEYFVVTTGSQPALRFLLQRIKDSSWANFEGFYILIDRDTEKRGCVYAYRYLWAAWEYNLILSVFICVDPEDGVLLYSYNPYSDRTPEAWQEAGRYRGRNGHPWILLKRKYDSDVCRDLIFDKTAALNGYEIRLNAIDMPPMLSIDVGKVEYTDMFFGDNADVIRTLFDKLNASMSVLIYNGTSHDLGAINRNGTMTGILEDVNSGKVDMGMNIRPLYVMWKLRYTYPHAEGGLCVITQPSGHIPEYRKILAFVSPNVILGVTVVYMIAHLALIRHEGFFLASLDMIRLMVSVSLLRPPKLLSSRIFISMAIMLLIIINALFQGHWASLLTVPVSYPNIETFEDLQNSELSIYGASVMRRALGDRILKSRYHSVSFDDCKENVLQSNNAACLGDCLHLFQQFQQEDVHRSKKIRDLVQVYVTREDWPLFTRVNSVIQRILEAGLINMWRQRNVRHFLRNRRVRRVKDKTGFKVLRLKQLSFSFYFLGIGYVCSIVVFLLELLIGRHRSRGNRNTRQPNGLNNFVRLGRR